MFDILHCTQTDNAEQRSVRWIRSVGFRTDFGGLAAHSKLCLSERSGSHGANVVENPKCLDVGHHRQRTGGAGERFVAVTDLLAETFGLVDAPAPSVTSDKVSRDASLVAEADDVLAT